MQNHASSPSIIFEKSRVLLFGLSMVLLLPSFGYACACGCNVFTVGTRWTMPIHTGFEAFLQYNFMDQSENWMKLIKLV